MMATFINLKSILFLCTSVQLLRPCISDGHTQRPISKDDIQTTGRNGFLANLSGKSLEYLRERISATCLEDLLYIVDNGLEKNHTWQSETWKWQQQMLDSYGGLPAGVLEGNVFWMGNFGQCVRVRVWKDGKNVSDQTAPDFRGKYCVSNFNNYIPIDKNKNHHGRLPIFATFGVCFPSSCTARDVQTVVNDRIKPLKAEITENECQTEQWNKLDPGTIMALIPFTILLTMVLLGTVCECVPLIRKQLAGHEWFQKHTKDQKFIVKLLIAFSAYGNTKKILDTSKECGELSCINGIRALSMLLVVTGHTSIAIMFIYARHNPGEFRFLKKKLWVQPLLEAIVCVETFFFLTGFLLTYIVLGKSSEKRRFNVAAFYLHRILRLGPAMILLAAFAAGPHQLLGNGPLWKSSPYYVTDICQRSWWKTALFIHTYFEKSPSAWVCAPHIWYIDVEMFYYILSPIILYPLVKKSPSGPIIWLTILIASFTVRLNIQFDSVEGITDPFTSFTMKTRQFQQIYIKPWYRPQPFLIGMFFGWVYYYKKKDLHLNKSAKSLIFMLVTLTMLFIIYGNYPHLSGMTTSPSKFIYVMEKTYMPAAWSICIGCIIIACATGNGGVVNKILSWKFLVPIGRLSFCAYLIHYNVLQNFSNSRKEPTYYDFKYVGSAWIAVNLGTLACAWIYSLLIEIPAIQLENLLMDKSRKPMKCQTKDQPDSVIINGNALT